MREAAARAGHATTRLVRKPAELLEALMDPNWESQPVHFDIPCNSQVFGRLLVDSGFEGVLYKSAKSGRRCLAVFTREMANSDSRIILAENRPSGIDYAELSASNCGDV